MPKNIHKRLKCKYEPSKYMLISQTKIRTKPVIHFLDTAQLHANLNLHSKTNQLCRLNSIVPTVAKIIKKR